MNIRIDFLLVGALALTVSTSLTSCIVQRTITDDTGVVVDQYYVEQHPIRDAVEDISTDQGDPLAAP